MTDSIEVSDRRIPVRVRMWLGGIVLLGIVFGPVVYMLAAIDWSGPLLASKTVTTTSTEYYGILPDVFNILPLILIWLIIWLVTEMMQR